MESLLDVHDTTRLTLYKLIEPYEQRLSDICDYISNSGDRSRDTAVEMNIIATNLYKAVSLVTAFEIERIAGIEMGAISPEPIRDDIDWADILAQSPVKEQLRTIKLPFVPLNEISCGEIPDRVNFRTVMQTYHALHSAVYDQSCSVNTAWRRSHLWGYQYTAILDSKTRASHKAQHGVTAPINSPFWKSWYPPNGYNCRCRCYPMYRKPKRVITPKISYHVDTGFDFNPTAVNIIEGQYKIEDMIG